MLLSLIPSLLLVLSQSGTPTHLDLPSGTPDSFSVKTRIAGTVVRLDLSRHNMRADGFLIQTSQGMMPQADIPETVVYFGSVRGMQDVKVIASLRSEGLVARVQFPETPDSWWRILPNKQRGKGWHFVSQETADFPETCGSETIETPAGVATIGSPPSAPTVSHQGNPSGGQHFGSPYGTDRWVIREAQIAYDADFCYYEREGSTIAGTIAGVEQQLAEMELCYAQDAQVTYELTAIVIRDQPYYPTFTSAGDALTQFYQEWDANQTHIPRDTAYFLTDYCNDGIAGLAYVGTLGGWSYAETVWDRGHSPGIMAHEVGHNWGAGHIDCWPWGGSAMCGAWLLLGPGTSDIVRDRADWLALPRQPAYPIDARPYADPDYAETDGTQPIHIDVLANDYDANLHGIQIDSFDTTTSNGAIISRSVGTGFAGRDELLYTPDISRIGGYSDTFWYTNIDEDGFTHSTPVTVTVRPHGIVAHWKFDEGSGTSIQDTTRRENNAVIQREPVFVEIQDPVITASANAYSSSYLASNILDNDSGTEYASDEQGPVTNLLSNNPSHGTWIEFDFGSSVEIDGFRHFDRDADVDKTAKSRLIFSADPVFNSQDTAIEISHRISSLSTDYSFERQTARYVRWEITEALDWYGTYNLGGKELAFLMKQDFVGVAAPSVTLSTEALNGYPSSQLFDGSLSTEFIARGSGETTIPYSRDTQHGTWVEADFGQSVSVDAIRFLDRTASNSWTKRSRLIFSSDTTFDANDPQVILNHYNQDFEITYSFTTLAGRYVRWEVLEKADPQSFSKLLGGSEMTFLQSSGNQPGFAWVNSPYGHCLEFDGTGVSASNCALDESLSQADDPWTLSFHYYFTQTPQDGTLIAGLGAPTDTLSNLHFLHSTNGMVTIADRATNVPWRTNAWMLLTAVFDGKKVHIYENGSHSESVRPFFSAPPSPELWVGGQKQSQTISLDGKIDELRYWNYALNDGEVLDLAYGGPASGPSPVNGSRTQPTNTQLSWVSGLYNPSHFVYLGTDFASVRDATPNSPEAKGLVHQTTFDPGPLNDLTSYFWRIDEIGGLTVKGDVWQFDTELTWSSIVYDGFEDGADNVPLDGLGGGLGFFNQWSATGTPFKHLTATMGAFPANIPFQEQGGHFKSAQNAASGNVAERFLNQADVDIDLGGDGTYYFSFAVKSTGNGYEPTAMIGLQAASSGESLLMGVRDGVWAVEGQAGQGTGFSFGRNTPWFAVARLDCHADATPDVLYLKYYNCLTDSVHASDTQLSGQGLGANEWSVISTGQHSTLHADKLILTAGAKSFTFASDVLMDEIRIGRSWTDVTGL